MTTTDSHRLALFSKRRRFAGFLVIPAANLLLAFVYLGAARLTLSLASLDIGPSSLWPPAGIALAALLVWGLRLWPGVFIGALLTGVLNHGAGTLTQDLGVAFGNTIEALLGAWLVNRYARGKNAFQQPLSILKFVLLAAGLSTMVSATIGVTSLGFTGVMHGDDLAEGWLRWWLGDATSVLVFAPFLVLWSDYGSFWRYSKRLKPAAVIEALVLGTLALGLTYWLFWTALPSDKSHYPIHYLIIFPLLWAAFRLGPRGAITIVVIMSVVAIGGSLRGFGPFAISAPREPLLWLQTFLGMIAVNNLFFAAAISESRRVTEALRDSESRLQLALSAGRLGVWEWDMASRRMRWSEDLEAIYGLKPGTFGGQVEDFKRFLHPDDTQRVIEEIDRAVAERLPFLITFRIKHADGNVHWMESVGRLAPDSQREPARMVGVCGDVTAQRLANAAILAQARQQSAVAELGQFALVAHDIQQVCDQAAASAAATLEAEYCAIMELSPDESEAILRAGHGWREGLVGKARVHIEPNSEFGLTHAHRHSIRAPGSKGELRLNPTPLLVEHGIECGITCVISGVKGRLWGILGVYTAEKRAFTQDELNFLQAVANVVGSAIQRRSMEQALRESDQRKDEFLALLAHELRNPLTPIHNVVEFMKLVPPEDQQLIRMRDVMDRQVSHLIRLVDDLLDVSRITRGSITLQKEEIDLGTVARNAIEAVQPLIDARKHSLTVTLPAEAACVEGDPVRLTQALGNLLSNAARYTPEHGQISLAVEVACNQVLLRVSDDGIGIPEGLLPNIFEPFVRGDQSLPKATSGLGVGLTLVRRIVEMHGGSVEARSRGIGRGSEFSIKLPRLAGVHPKAINSAQNMALSL